MTEEIRNAERELEEEIRKLGLDEDTEMLPEVITTKDPTVLPAVSLAGSNTEKTTKEGVSSLRKANAILKKIATSLEKERAKLQEVYKVKEKYFTSENSEKLKQIPAKLIETFAKKNLSRSELAEAAELISLWDNQQKLQIKLDKEIETCRQSIEKLKGDLVKEGVKPDDKIVVRVRKPIFTKLAERFKLAKAVRDLKGIRKGFMAANKHDDDITDKKLQRALLRGKSLDEAAESISDKSFEEIQKDLDGFQQEYIDIFTESEKYVRENGHYLMEHLDKKEKSWNQYYGGLIDYVVKRQELERKNHYEELRELSTKYPVSKKEDGTLVYDVNGEEIEVSKQNFIADMEKVLAASKKSAPKDIEENKEQFDEPGQPLPVIPEIEEERLTPKPTEKESKKEKDIYTIQMDALDEEIKNIRERLDQIRVNNNNVRIRQQEEDLGRKMAEEKATEIAKEKAEYYADVFSVNPEDVVVTEKVNQDNIQDNEVNYGSDNDKLIIEERQQLEEELKQKLEKHNELFEARKQAKIDADKKARAERIAEINKQGLLSEAHKFFRHLDTSTTKGYDVSDLDDDKVIELYNEIRENPMNSVYKKTMETMNNDYREEQPKMDENFENELQAEVDSQIAANDLNNGNSMKDKANEVVISHFADQFKASGMDDSQATMEAIKYFKEQFPLDNVPESYSKYVDTSGIDVSVYDEDPNSFAQTGKVR